MKSLLQTDHSIVPNEQFWGATEVLRTQQTDDSFLYWYEQYLVETAARLRAPVIEIHVGAWCDALAAGHAAVAQAQWTRIREGAKLASSLGLEVHAGHGLDYSTAEAIAALPELVELNIGHFLIGEATFVGLGETVRAMRAAMDRGRARASG